MYKHTRRYPSPLHSSLSHLLTFNPHALITQQNPRSVPYAFWHLPLKGLPPGFPAFLDINLSEQGAHTWLSWLQVHMCVSIGFSA